MIRMTPTDVRAERARMDARGKANGQISELGRKVELLTRLVERMGDDLGVPWQGYEYTISGQRERDAAMHDAEGEPETRESTGAWGALG